MRINLKRRYVDDAKRNILAHLLAQLCNEYDMDPSAMRTYIENTEKHLAVFVEYLTGLGYKVKAYRFDGVDATILSWGLEFDDTCDLTLALKIRYAEQ